MVVWMGETPLEPGASYLVKQASSEVPAVVRDLRYRIDIHSMHREQTEYPDRLWGVPDEPRPLAVQIWDNDPQTLAQVGARLAHEFQVSVVDINFGCPVRRVTERAHSGSYLLKFPQRMASIIEAVVKACAPTPVTVKIRLGCTREDIRAIEVAQVVCGLNAKI